MHSFNIQNKILLILLAASLVLIFFLPVNDPDFGWHYRCGEQTLTQHQLCLTNNFSYFLPDYQWVYSCLVYGVTLAWTFNNFGFMGVSLLGAVIFSSVFLMFYFLAENLSLVKIAAIFFIIFLSQNVFSLGYRSQILGLLFFVLALFIVKKIDSAGNNFSKYVFLIPVLLFFWANTHLSFFLGLLIFGAFLAEKIIKTFFCKQHNTWLLLRYFLIFLFSALIVCANPFGWRIYQEIVRHFSAPLNTMIAEWVEPVGWQKMLIILSTLGTIFLYIKQKKFDYRFFLFPIFAYFAISARRNLPIYYIMIFYILIDFLNFQILCSKKIIRFSNFLATAALAVIIIFWGLPIIPRTVLFSTDYATYCQNNVLRLPCGAVKQMKDKTGNVFNSYEWGGFLVWRLPNIKVFIDGRMPAWQDKQGRYPYAVFLDIIQTQPGWNEQLKKYDTDYLLIGNGTFLDLLLKEDIKKIYGWQEEYRDKIAVIYHQTTK